MYNGDSTRLPLYEGENDPVDLDASACGLGGDAQYDRWVVYIDAVDAVVKKHWIELGILNPDGTNGPNWGKNKWLASTTRPDSP
jgi:hypothetical protein